MTREQLPASPRGLIAKLRRRRRGARPAPERRDPPAPRAQRAAPAGPLVGRRIDVPGLAAWLETWAS